MQVHVLLRLLPTALLWRLQRGITKVQGYSLSKLLGNNIATAGAAAAQIAATPVRMAQSIVHSAGTRMYICIVDAPSLTIHVLALSLTTMTRLGVLEWPGLSMSGAGSSKPLKCALTCPMHAQAR